MKSIIFFAVVVALAQGQKMFFPFHGLPPADPPDARAAQPTWGYINQRQDNFDLSNRNTWTMRFKENGQFFRTDGPIFIMLGAEWTINDNWLQTGQMYQMAEINGAQMYYTEYRYYGESYPTRDLSSENLKYLTTAQALEDIAQFIIKMKQKPAFTNSKVVVFGGSYGGNIAMWMREKYPNLVHAAVSSSAPLRAQVDFHEYYEIVQKVIGPECASVYTKGIAEVQRLFRMGEVAKVQKDFKSCWQTNIQNKYDVQYFFFTIAANIGNKVQYANPSTVSNVCNSLQYPTYLTDYERLAAFSRNPDYCSWNYDYFKRDRSNISLYHGDDRQYMYQLCTEFASFQSSFASTSMFGYTMPVDMYNQWCLDFFGPAFTAAVTENGVAATNAKYGALNPNVTRVVSVHGTADPWHALGLSKDLNSEAPVIIVPGTSHIADLYSLSSSNSYDMYMAKLAVRKYIATWLQQP